MPTFEYECNECGFRFGLFQTMTDKPLRVCPKCGEPITRLNQSGGRIIFKGTCCQSTDNKK